MILKLLHRLHLQHQVRLAANRTMRRLFSLSDEVALAAGSGHVSTRGGGGGDEEGRGGPAGDGSPASASGNL